MTELGHVQLTTSCRDTDAIPKVDNAGAVLSAPQGSVQVMHTGVLIAEGCYYGQWMTDIIRHLHGHHEPQEEVVFREIVEQLATDTTRPTMLELGAFWAYYSLWMLQRMPDPRGTSWSLTRTTSRSDTGTSLSTIARPRLRTLPSGRCSHPARSFGEPVSDLARYEAERFVIDERLGTTLAAVEDAEAAGAHCDGDDCAGRGGTQFDQGDGDVANASADAAFAGRTDCPDDRKPRV